MDTNYDSDPNKIQQIMRQLPHVTLERAKELLCIHKGNVLDAIMGDVEIEEKHVEIKICNQTSETDWNHIRQMCDEKDNAMQAWMQTFMQK